MFERYTDRAIRSVELARECARALNHAEITPGHMLAGLMAEGGGVAWQALKTFGLDPGAVPEALASRTPRSTKPLPAVIPFGPRGKKVCELAFREALQFGHNYIGTEHILLGLIREGEGSGAGILVALGLNPGDVRAKVAEMLRGYDDAARGSAPAAPSPCTRCNGSGSEPQSPPTPSSLTDRLAVITADLDGYVERRAKEMAQPADRVFLSALRDTLSLVARDETTDITDARAVAAVLDRSARAAASLTMALDAFLAAPVVTPEALIDDARAILAGEDGSGG